MTPTSVLEARLGFTHILGGKFPVYLGGASMQQLYGIPGVPDSRDFVGGLNTQNVSGYSGFGRQATNPQFQNPTTWNPKVNYALNLGRHAIKTGFEFTTIRTEVMDINPVYGLNAYAGQFSRPSATSPADANTYNLADFLFGLPEPGATRELPHHQLSPASILPVRPGRLPRELETDVESRSALGIRDSALGTRQRSDELRSQ